VIVLDGGTTTLELARRLPLLYDGIVVTNSPPVASALADHPKAEVMLVGGRLLKDRAGRGRGGCR
jgi:Transcriptional regulators of sugar metabolism